MPELWTVAQYLLLAYFSIAFAKFCLMVSTAHVAVATHRRALERRGYRVGWLKCYFGCVVTILIITAISLPTALYRERWSYFVAYKPRQIMRDILSEYRG